MMLRRASRLSSIAALILSSLLTLPARAANIESLELVPLKKSAGQDAYLLRLPPDSPVPPVGKDVLILNEQKKGLVMLKVLKAAPEKHLIMAKAAKTYPGYNGLTLQQSYSARMRAGAAASPKESNPVAVKDWTPEPESGFYVRPIVGFSMISHDETVNLSLATSNFSMKSLDVGLEGHWDFTPEWSLRGASSFTALSLGNNTPGTSARFINIAGDIDYTVYRSLQWRFDLLAEWRYRTTVINTGTDTSFGYQNVMAPCIYPAVAYRFDDKQSVEFMAHYALLTNNLKFLGMGSHEWGLSLAYAWGHPGHGIIRVSLDYTRLTIDFGAINPSLVGWGSHTSLMGLSGGYTF